MERKCKRALGGRSVGWITAQGKGEVRTSVGGEAGRRGRGREWCVWEAGVADIFDLSGMVVAMLSRRSRTTTPEYHRSQLRDICRLHGNHVEPVIQEEGSSMMNCLR